MPLSRKLEHSTRKKLGFLLSKPGLLQLTVSDSARLLTVRSSQAVELSTSVSSNQKRSPRS